MEPSSFKELTKCPRAKVVCGGPGSLKSTATMQTFEATPEQSLLFLPLFIHDAISRN